MKFLTDKKITIIGAAGMIGSNMAQCALMLHLSPNICLYDPYLPGLKGVAEELLQSDFNDAEIKHTDDIKEALKDAEYIVSSGGAPRKSGMTREDLLKGNAEIAAELGKNIRLYAPAVKHVVVVFNPADITGLVTLIHSGLKPSQISTLAALDSTRLRSALAKHFKLPMNKINNCKTLGGHGEQMTIFASPIKIDGISLLNYIGTEMLPINEWNEIKEHVIQGGKEIIDLRGRSSFQSPAYLSIKMLEASIGGKQFKLPAGTYVNNNAFHNIFMAMNTRIDCNGISYKTINGTESEEQQLLYSYLHLCSMRDEVIKMGVIPEIKNWGVLNPYL
ncbi:MAG: malate dehydrogenase [Muribaculaceae bacterium]|nr:malate dehydrogenase [Muribaculaceae bacterium]